MLYRQVAELLAEPREQVSYREIARCCGVGHTIKAIEQAESASIAERKAKMLKQVTRVAERAWQTVADKLEGANLAQATICAGVATDKMLLLAGEPTVNVSVNFQALDLHSELVQLRAEIHGALREPFPAPPLAILEAEVVG